VRLEKWEDILGEVRDESGGREGHSREREQARQRIQRK
jgi:hypothetical protein